MIQLLTAQEGEKAAQDLVNFALGRHAADSVSAAILQIPAEEKVVVPVNQPSIGRNHPTISTIISSFLIP